MTSLHRQFAFLLFALTLALQCFALEGRIEKIQISFSVWSPDSMDFNIVERIVLNALRDFFCQETESVLLNTNFRSACIPRENGNESAASEDNKTVMLGFIKQSDPDRSYLLDDASIVRMSFPSKRSTNLKGTLWLTSYEILQIGTKATARARRDNLPDGTAYLEQTIQESLDRSIFEGVLHQRFERTNIILGEYQPQDMDGISSRNEYVETARILRYIGIGLLLGSSLIHYLLYELGRRYRPQSEYKEVEVGESQYTDLEHQRGLGTEEGVNRMLEEGRRQTERIRSSSHRSI